MPLNLGRHADNVIASSYTWFESLSLWIIKLTALLVPKLENYANSSLLEQGADLRFMLILLMEAGLYIGLLACLVVIEIKKKIL